MYNTTSYNDLLNNIELSKARISYIGEQRELLIKMMDIDRPKDIIAMQYSDMPSGGKKVSISLDRLVTALNKLDISLDFEEQMLLNMVELQKQSVELLNHFEGLEYKVAYLLHVKGFTVQEVADKLGYSFTYMQNISAKVNKEVV